MSGINKVKSEEQEVKLLLGGVERTLRYDMNAFGVLEQKFGSVEAAMETMTEGKVGNIKVLLWAGLIHSEVSAFDEETGEPLAYNITPYQVGAMIKSPGELTEIVTAMASAISSSLPDEVGKPEELKEIKAPAKKAPKASSAKPVQ